MSDRVIQRDEAVLGGTPVFADTHVPVTALLDALAAGRTLDEFLSDHPSVTREQAGAVIDLAREALDAGRHPG
ncbi:MAG: DUF433 domain-containing protein [Planctomycetota bacterium]|jgi:uncharacterized protein (DUF433 family)